MRRGVTVRGLWRAGIGVKRRQLPTPKKANSQRAGFGSWELRCWELSGPHASVRPQRLGRIDVRRAVGRRPGRHDGDREKTEDGPREARGAERLDLEQQRTNESREIHTAGEP